MMAHTQCKQVGADTPSDEVIVRYVCYSSEGRILTSGYAAVVGGRGGLILGASLGGVSLVDLQTKVIWSRKTEPGG